MFLVGQELWIDGGRDETGEIGGDMFRISRKSFAVKKVRYAPGPTPRVACCWAVPQHVLYIYGGGTETIQAMGDFWIFNWSVGVLPPGMIGCAPTLLPNYLLLIGMKSEGRKECVIFQFSIENQR
jgi:hypothetical protein